MANDSNDSNVDYVYHVGQATRDIKCGHVHIIEADNKTECEKGLRVWQKQHRCKKAKVAR